MNALVAILILVLLCAVVLVIGAPLRARWLAEHRTGAGTEGAGEGGTEAHGVAALQRDELESAREAKYREIRDSELDYRTGKLSAEDYSAIDTQLRAEAIEILNRLEQVEAREAGATEEAQGSAMAEDDGLGEQVDADESMS